jgi:hypothetical protein
VLIQELVAEGCYAVTNSQPTGDETPCGCTRRPQ